MMISKLIQQTALRATPLATALLLAVAVPGGPARADGMFLQIDAAPEAGSAVFSMERSRLTFGASFNVYEDGRAAGLSTLYRVAAVAEGAPVNVKLGPAVGWV